MLKDLDIKEFKAKVLTSEVIQKIIDKHNLSSKEVKSAWPIWIEIYQKTETNKQNHLYYELDIYKTNQNKIMLTKKMTKFGKKNLALTNIVTKKIFNLNFEFEKKFHKNKKRGQIINGYFLKLMLDNQENKNLFLFGKSYTGKSFFIKRIMVNLAQKNIKIAYMDVQEMFNILKNSFKNKDKFYPNYQELFYQADLVIIDDIGNEIIKPWFRDDFLFNIIRYRLNKKKPLVLVSEYDLKTLVKMENYDNNFKIKNIFKKFEESSIKHFFDEKISQ